MHKQMYTVPEFLHQFSISRTSFYSEIKKGKLRLIKRGRRSLVAASDAQEWLNDLRLASSGDNNG